MTYAEIKVSIRVNEEKLTNVQQVLANRAKVNSKEEHPLERGVEDLKDTIERIGLNSFGYLDKSIDAVSVDVV